MSNCYLVAGESGAPQGNYAARALAEYVQRGPNSARERQTITFFRSLCYARGRLSRGLVELAQIRLQRRLRAALFGFFVRGIYFQRKQSQRTRTNAPAPLGRQIATGTWRRAPAVSGALVVGHYDP